MANLDSDIPFFWQGGGTLTIEDDDGHSIVITYEQGTFSWSESGRPYSEALSRGRRSTSAAPVLIEGDDGQVTGQGTCLITSFRGNANVHPYEALTFSGNAAAWVSTARGNKKALRLILTCDSSGAGGGVQTKTFRYVVPTSVDPDMGGAEGKTQLTFSFTDHENTPVSA